MPINEQHFCAKTWIKHLQNGGTNLNDETIHVVSSFALMWNIFENGLCGNSANSTKLGNICRDIQITPELSEQIESSLSHFKQRYVTGTEFSQYFDGLNFRPNDNKTHVESVLLGTATTNKDKLLALLIIIYRFRNNLFHGLKRIGSLNDQVENLDTANRLLAAVLQARGFQI